jgi:hypothetical protein
MDSGIPPQWTWTKLIRVWISDQGREVIMERLLTVSLDEEDVRFTSDGRMSVLDAIRALTLSKNPERIWKDLKDKHPKLLDHCEDRKDPHEGLLTVVDGEGWDMMWTLLIAYILDPQEDASLHQSN